MGNGPNDAVTPAVRNWKEDARPLLQRTSDDEADCQHQSVKPRPVLG